MHDVPLALLTRDRPIEQQAWRSFWDRLHEGGLQRGETVALLASLATRMPDQDTLSAFLRSLDERRPQPVGLPDGTVNIVGTGGGPSTFNISTAAALVAAAMGVRVAKTGSRAYTSTCGSQDLLELLGIPLTTSYEQTGAMLERHGIAFPGHFVYPRELMLLAKSILPLELRTLGRFVNAVGPFLAAMPVSCRLVGVADPSLLPTLRYVADSTPDRRTWLCSNAQGIDELVSSVDNVIHSNDGTGPELLRADASGPYSITDLRPAGRKEEVVAHFLDVLSGKGGPLATRTVCLNAAALAVASGLVEDWTDARAAADDALRSGRALDLVNRLRTQPGRTTAGGAGLR
ncbi:anthranilate phosphoribosyltransferase [Streptomyces sp. NBC_00237]|uniref:anthranilate phosphoribosyltransferase n=1 Tax=Streptomyces sp. NBC_00237 TaxID=2975687 RepID=UPI00225B0A0C|nr:anthranilate phosphoribosyltransferase [Streptomyces sp. NBC_00237]MCX5202716.1 anthranilate phosphoribosyltransferase [Streptomyces sp. NBC_00237]